jgi:hypothetical protein
MSSVLMAVARRCSVASERRTSFKMAAKDVSSPLSFLRSVYWSCLGLATCAMLKLTRRFHQHLIRRRDAD